MKTIIRNILAVVFIAISLQTHAQNFIYDQQSATNGVSLYADNVDGLNIQEDSPLLQSFIPSLAGIGFVQFEFWDIPNNGTNGATVYVNLWTGSPNINSATLLGSTTPVYMPDGFMTEGLGGGGVTNFYFSIPIVLTPEQTYYLQPVVLSGDDPWDIINIGDTYPNGQLFESGFGFNTDLWFREGIVPEPSTLALIGLSGLLAFSFKRRSKWFLVFLLAASALSIHAASDSVVQATADSAGLPRVSSSSVPRTGTFWVVGVDADGRINKIPYPFLPPSLSTLPIYSVANNIFIVDDTGGQLASASAARMSSAQASV